MEETNERSARTFPLFSWENLDNLYRKRIELLECVGENYKHYNVQEYLSWMDIGLFLWILFLYTCTVILGWFSWFWRLCFICLIVLERSREHSNNRKLQLRHAVAIAGENELQTLKKDIQQKIEHLNYVANIQKSVNGEPEEISEWLNKLLDAAWPYTENWIRVLVNQIETQLEQSMSDTLLLAGINAAQLIGLKFTRVNLGSQKPSITSVIFRKGNQGIAIDVNIKYRGNCEVLVTSNDAFTAGIKDLQFTGIMRIDAGPMMAHPPFVEKLDLFFLEPPEIDFNSIGLARTDIVRKLITTNIMGIINGLMVYPNKIPVPMVATEQLECPPPFGVILVNVVGAENLANLDLLGKSDPYCIVSYGGWQIRTRTINNDLNPKWNYYTMVVCNCDPKLGGQFINFLVRDFDIKADEDLLRTQLSVRRIYDSPGIVEQKLTEPDKIKRGSLNVRALWLNMSTDLSKVNEISTFKKVVESMDTQKDKKKEKLEIFTCVLMVWLVGAHNIQPSEAELFVRLCVGDQTKESLVTPHGEENHTWFWRQGFHFTVFHPDQEKLDITIIDRSNKDREKGHLQISISRELLRSQDLKVPQKSYDLPDSLTNGQITIGLSLRTIDPGEQQNLQQIFFPNFTGLYNTNAVRRRNFKALPLIAQKINSGASGSEGIHPTHDSNLKSCQSTFDIRSGTSDMSRPSTPESTYSLPTDLSPTETSEAHGTQPSDVVGDLRSLNNSNEKKQKKKRSKLSVFKILKFKKKRKRDDI